MAKRGRPRKDSRITRTRERKTFEELTDRGKNMRINTLTDALASVDGWKALSLAMLHQAKTDASKGSLEALRWLTVYGSDLIMILNPDYEQKLLQFCKDVMTDIKSGKLPVNYDTIKDFKKTKAYQETQQTLFEYQKT